MEKGNWVYGCGAYMDQVYVNLVEGQKGIVRVEVPVKMLLQRRSEPSKADIR